MKRGRSAACRRAAPHAGSASVHGRRRRVAIQTDSGPLHRQTVCASAAGIIGWAVLDWCETGMYELTCPKCGHAVTSSFVRVGAVVTCERCGHRYRIGEQHIKRRFVATGQGGLSGRPSGPTADAEPRLDADGNVVGLSGLSDVMRREDDAEPAVAKEASGDERLPVATAVRTTRPQPSTPVSAASARSSRRGAREAVRRRRAKSTYMLLGVLVLAVGMLGIGLWYAGTRTRGTGAKASADPANAGVPDDGALELDPDLPMVKATRRVASSSWAERSRPRPRP